MNESMKTSLQIFKKMLQNERISSNKNNELFDEYRTNSEVQSNIEEICNIFDLQMYDYNQEGLFITPGVNNSVFGYSNAELKKILKAENDADLSLYLFIMYCIFSFIYKESTTLQARDFIRHEDALKSCEDKILLVEKHIEDMEENEEEVDVSFKTLVKSWKDKNLINPKSKAQNPLNDTTSQSKTAYINRVLRFFCEINLFAKDEHQNIYLILPRLSAIVGYYYDEVAHRNLITEYLDKMTIDY